jgi:hypothetical protein
MDHHPRPFQFHDPSTTLPRRSTPHTHAAHARKSNPPGDVSENLSCTGAGSGDFENNGEIPQKSEALGMMENNGEIPQKSEAPYQSQSNPGFKTATADTRQYMSAVYVSAVYVSAVYASVI